MNRAIVNTENNWLVNIVEHYDISTEDIRLGLYTGNELTSMNIFAFRPDIFSFMENKVGSCGIVVERIAQRFLS